jgi:hypothetical protein
MADQPQTIDARAIFITLMLREDSHQKLIKLFGQFDEAMNKNEKRDIVTAVLQALKIHAKLEEELLYPAWREHMDAQDLIDEAIEEHHVVHLLIEELDNLNPEDKRYDAKFRLLREHVKHHVEVRSGRCYPEPRRLTSIGSD